jgi:hypothetical protein
MVPVRKTNEKGLAKSLWGFVFISNLRTQSFKLKEFFFRLCLNFDSCRCEQEVALEMERKARSGRGLWK